MVKTAHHLFITICAASGSGRMEDIMKKIFGLVMLLLLSLNLTPSLAEGINLKDDEVNGINDYFEKIIEEKTGIKVKATEGILYYDEDQANKSLQLRNDDSSKIIEEKTGIKVKAIEGILYYDTTKGKDSKVFNGNGIGIEAISPPTTVNRDYPYEANWSGTINYSYSRYLFRLDAPETYFSSFAKTPYHAEFYGIDGKYWFTLRGRKGSTSYSASVSLLNDLIDYYNAYDYYIIMYNDDPYSSAQEACYILVSVK